MKEGGTLLVYDSAQTRDHKKNLGNLSQKQDGNLNLTQPPHTSRKTHRLFPLRRSTRCKVGPRHEFTGQKVCFSRFTPYCLFMIQSLREGGAQKQRNPPSRRSLMWKTESLFKLASNAIQMTHEFNKSFYLCVFTCLCPHTHTRCSNLCGG